MPYEGNVCPMRVIVPYEGYEVGEKERTHTHTPEEVPLLLALLLCTGQEVELCPVGRVREVESSAGQQFTHILHQLQVRSAAQGGKGRLRDAKHLHIPHLHIHKTHITLLLVRVRHVTPAVMNLENVGSD